MYFTKLPRVIVSKIFDYCHYPHIALTCNYFLRVLREINTTYKAYINTAPKLRIGVIAQMSFDSIKLYMKPIGEKNIIEGMIIVSHFLSNDPAVFKYVFDKFAKYGDTYYYISIKHVTNFNIDNMKMLSDYAKSNKICFELDDSIIHNISQQQFEIVKSIVCDNSTNNHAGAVFYSRSGRFLILKCETISQFQMCLPYGNNYEIESTIIYSSGELTDYLLQNKYYNMFSILKLCEQSIIEGKDDTFKKVFTHMFPTPILFQNLPSSFFEIAIWLTRHKKSDLLVFIKSVIL